MADRKCTEVPQSGKTSAGDRENPPDPRAYGISGTSVGGDFLYNPAYGENQIDRRDDENSGERQIFQGKTFPVEKSNMILAVRHCMHGNFRFRIP